MDLEQLKRGKEIEQKILNLSKEKQEVEKISQVDRVIFENINGGRRTISSENFDVDLCKTVLISNINKKINALEAEFEKL